MKATSILFSLIAFIAFGATSTTAFDLDFGTQTCASVEVTFTLEPYEYKYGDHVSVWGGDNQDWELGSLAIKPYFSSSSLNGSYTIRPEMYTMYSTSGTYTFGFGVYGADKTILNYFGQAGKPDFETKQLSLSCGGATPTSTLSYTATATNSKGYAVTVEPSSTISASPTPCGGFATSTSLAGRDIHVLERRCISKPSSRPLPPQDNAAVIGGAVGGSLGGVALIGLIVFVVLRRRRRQQDAVFSPSIEVIEGASDPEKGSISDVPVQAGYQAAYSFDVTFRPSTCESLDMIINLEQFELQQGYTIRLDAVDSSLPYNLATLPLSKNFGSSLQSQITLYGLDTYYKQSGTYKIKFGIIGASGDYIQYHNDGADDAEVETVSLTCTTGETSTSSTTPSFTHSTTTSTTPSYTYPTTTPHTSLLPSTTTSASTTYTYTDCKGAVQTIVEPANVTFFGPSCSSKSNKGAVIGGAVGGVLGGLVLLGALTAFLVLQRRKKSAEQAGFATTQNQFAVSEDPEKESDFNDVSTVERMDQQEQHDDPAHFHYGAWTRD